MRKTMMDSMNTVIMGVVKQLNEAEAHVKAAKAEAELAETMLTGIRPMIEQLVAFIMEMDKAEKKRKKEPELKSIVYPAKQENGTYIPTKFYLASSLNRVLGRPDYDYAVAEMLSVVPFGHVAWIKRGEVVWIGGCRDYTGSTMSRWVDQWGYEFILKWWDGQKGKVGKRNHHYDRERICELYREGWRFEDIAKECNVCDGTVFNVVKAAGLKRCTKWDGEELRRLVAEGKTDNEIAEMKGVSVDAVMKIRQYYGIFRGKRRKAASNPGTESSVA